MNLLNMNNIFVVNLLFVLMFHDVLPNTLPMINIQANETMSPEQRHQLAKIEEEKGRCFERISKHNSVVTQEGLCPMVWDGFLCWPSSHSGISTQTCPYYIYGFNPNANATKICTEDGQWFISEDTHDTWTNYTMCFYRGDYEPSHSIELHIPNFKLITQIGYSISLATLLVAFFILTFIRRISFSSRRLRCPRNSLHLQLFISFMIRSFMFLIKNIFVSPQTQNTTNQHTALTFTNYEGLLNDPLEIPTVSCKIVTTIWQYSLVANYNWILMEGLYLHNLIFFNIFNDNSSIAKYVVAGWALPILFIIPWVIVRILYENTLCWTTHKNIAFFWIIRGPITATIILNFIFFINITRVVFLKMFSSVGHTNRQYRYRKWFKSTLVLVPLFGVHYMVLLIFSSLTVMSKDIIEIIWLYIDLLFSSFQGCVVALLYCFFNGEVQQELCKIWQSWRSKQFTQRNSTATHNSFLTQSLTYLNRGRNSVLSTCDNITKRDQVNFDSTTTSPTQKNFCHRHDSIKSDDENDPFNHKAKYLFPNTETPI